MNEEVKISEEDLPDVNEINVQDETIQTTTDNEENMEVHKHPHHVTHKKKWTEFMLEFFMIFFAVFLGFFAENIREHYAERKKEKDYIETMVDDLKKDSAYLQLCIYRLIPQHVKYFDSTQAYLQLSHPQLKSKELYQAFLTATHWNFNYVPTQRTLSQLRSTGFYVIRNSRVGDILSELEINYSVYASKNAFIQELQNDIDQSSYFFAKKDVVNAIHVNGFADTSEAVVNVDNLAVPAEINTSDKQGTRTYISKINKYSYYINTILRNDYTALLKFIGKTIALLKEEYQLE